MVEGIFFDLDGTLFFSTPVLHSAYETGVKKFNRQKDKNVGVPTETEVLDQVGNPVEEIYANLFPDLEPRARELLTEEIVADLLDKISSGGGRLAEGVPAVLEELGENHTLALVTNAARPYLETVVDTYGLGNYFTGMICAGDVPDTDKSGLIRLMLEETGLMAAEVVMVGDRSSDRLAARRAGTEFIGCNYGHGGGDTFAGDQTLASLHELPVILGTAGSAP